MRNPAEFLVRPAAAGDAPAILQLWLELMDFHQSRDPIYTRSADSLENFAHFLHEKIEDSQACVLVAVCQERLVGYALGVVSAYPPVFALRRYGQVLDMVVTSGFRRRGVGEKLFLALKTWYAGQGIDRLEVRVAVRNEVSTRFWRTLGFKPSMELLAFDLKLLK